MITPAQCRAARALLDWSQQDLAKAAHLSLSTIRDFEKGRRVPTHNNLRGIKLALEEEGVEVGAERSGVAIIKPNA
ncbi:MULTISPECIES: helix-turn-helix transcriptional regulator [Bosea]|uniref:helix-turn-helix domain-containing protein n=1 Tax=Bosea TaxID=85413 RepID=UPI0021501E3D|nr:MULTISPECIES: helix-turn-helix transcriptional regulator [Bosea]MCR4523796.1 helix-turn-helix domain-containing protein [Bosea sp. 47.2.35]